MKELLKNEIVSGIDISLYKNGNKFEVVEDKEHTYKFKTLEEAEFKILSLKRFFSLPCEITVVHPKFC